MAQNGRPNTRIPLSSLAYERLKDMLVNFEVRPGTALVELELITKFGMSRTPIREALHRLTQEGFISLVPGKGWFVAEVSLKEVQEIFVVREGLEGIAARQAAVGLSADQLAKLRNYMAAIDLKVVTDDGKTDPGDRIHDFILDGANNSHLKAAISLYSNHLRRFHYIALRLPGRALQSYHEHWGIMEALEMRDADLAERRMREHIQSTRRSLFSSLAEGQTWW